MYRIDYIIEVTCSILDIPIYKIMEDNRQRQYTEARAIITHIAREEQFTYMDIGKAMGRRHHGAVMNSHKRSKLWINVDATFKKRVNLIKAYLGDSYQDYLHNDNYVKSIARMDLCVSRVTSLMASFKKELVQLRKLKKEFMKQRRRVKPGPRATTTK